MHSIRKIFLKVYEQEEKQCSFILNSLIMLQLPNYCFFLSPVPLLSSVLSLYSIYTHNDLLFFL